MRLVVVLAFAVLCSFGGQKKYPFRAVLLILHLPMMATEPNATEAKDNRLMDIYCYNGHNGTLLDMFRTVTVTVESTGEYDVYLGQDKFEVGLRKDRHLPHVFQRALLSDKRNPTIQLDPFKACCIGVVTTSPYSIQLVVNRIDTVRMLCFVIGSIFLSVGGGYSLDEVSFGFCQICILFWFDFMVNGCGSITCWMFIGIGLAIILVATNSVELGEQFLPAGVDTVPEMLARLLAIGVGSILASFGVGNNAPLAKWVRDNVIAVR